MYQLKRSEQEINDLMNRADEQFDQTTDPRAETVGLTVRWLVGDTDEDPLG